jgi:alpha-glucoside transport system permease protein
VTEDRLAAGTPAGAVPPPSPPPLGEKLPAGQVPAGQVPAGELPGKRLLGERLLGEMVLLDDVGPARRGRAYPAAGAALILFVPAGLLLGALVLWPVVRTLQASVIDPDTHAFVGLANFELPWPVIGRTVLWALVVPAVVTALGYLLASASRRTYEGRLVRLILLPPIAVPLVVTAVVFRLMYDPDPGRGTATALAARLFGRAPSFLGPTLITVSLMSAFVWAWVGLAVVVFRAALDAIPTNLADSVRAYGGTRLDVFRDARWQPLVRRTVAVVFALVALATARTFDLILVLAPGSVRDSASVLAVRVWQTSGGTTSGPGAALGVLWLAIVALGMVLASLGIRQAWPPPTIATLPKKNRKTRRSAPTGVPRADGGETDAGETDRAGADGAGADGADTDEGDTDGGEPEAEDDGPSPADRPGPAVRAVRAVGRTVPSVAAVVWTFPLLVLVATSLHTPRDAATVGWWRAPLSWASYRQIFDGDALTRSLEFTAVLALVVTAVVVALALLAAYPLAWLAGPAAQAVGLVLLAAAVVPVQVIAGPVNEVLAIVRLSGSAPGLALVHVALGLPFTILVLRNALADVPAAQLRRARLTSQREWDTVWRMARSIRPAVVAVCVLEFVQVWNDLAVGLLFSGPDGTPLGLLVYGQARGFVTASGPLAAISTLVSVVPVLLVVLARRQVVAGLVSGALR